MIEENILKDDELETIKIFINTESNTNILYRYNKINNITKVFDNNFNLILHESVVGITVISNNNILGGWSDTVTIKSISKYGLDIMDKYNNECTKAFEDILSINVYEIENCK